MNEPVTTTSPISVAALWVAAWAIAWPERPNARVAASTEALQKNLLLVINFSSPRQPLFDGPS
jgi:hypothetical protein